MTWLWEVGGRGQGAQPGILMVYLISADIACDIGYLICAPKPEARVAQAQALAGRRESRSRKQDRHRHRHSQVKDRDRDRDRFLVEF